MANVAAQIGDSGAHTGRTGIGDEECAVVLAEMKMARWPAAGRDGLTARDKSCAL
jgi:hypothetical protein